MPVKKKPSAAQLAARAKFVKMVRAKAAAKKTAAKKIGVWYKGNTAFIEQNEKKPINSNSVQKVTRRKITKPGTFKDFTKVSGLDKVVRKGNKTAVLYTKLSGLFDTSIITEIDQLKKEYFKLAKKYHPDAGGTKEQFQTLQLEYEVLLKKLLSGSKLSQDQQANEIVLDEALRKAVDAIIGIPNINIELIGKWIWVSGLTFPVRNELGAAGFTWAPKKKMWYYAGIESKGRGNLTMDEIKKKYGSSKIMPKDNNKFISGYPKITRVQRAKFKSNLIKATKALNKRVV
jgi:hypothetical protein